MTLESFRRFANGRGALALATFVGVAAGLAGGWISHGAYASASARERPAQTCRDEVTSIDNAHGAVSCSSPDMTSEVIKDGYLVCKCKKK